MLTYPDGTDAATLTREKEIRALALQAAATVMARTTKPQMDYGKVLGLARHFEEYIETGTWTGDPEAETRS